MGWPLIMNHTDLYCTLMCPKDPKSTRVFLSNARIAWVQQHVLLFKVTHGLQVVHEAKVEICEGDVVHVLMSPDWLKGKSAGKCLYYHDLWRGSLHFSCKSAGSAGWLMVMEFNGVTMGSMVDYELNLWYWAAYSCFMVALIDVASWPYQWGYPPASQAVGSPPLYNPTMNGWWWWSLTPSDGPIIWIISAQGTWVGVHRQAYRPSSSTGYMQSP